MTKMTKPKQIPKDQLIDLINTAYEEGKVVLAQLTIEIHDSDKEFINKHRYEHTLGVRI